MKKIILSLVFSICIAFQALAFQVGDKVYARFLCEKADSAQYLVQTKDDQGEEEANKAIVEMLQSGYCVILPEPVEIELMKIVKQYKTEQVVEVKVTGAPEHLRFYSIGPIKSKGDI